ncbi:MAG: hypothetical protein DRP42_00920 [Tenericutes bacterium]|nr:MAG: hypothetical protein DRP42_00920 [Mycoplasmatota bacterium]
MKSARLHKIVSYVRKDDRVLDIGADHAYVPILLREQNLTTVADVAEITRGPLESARKNIIASGFRNQINLFLSDGVLSVDINKYDTFVIAGMGGISINTILRQKKIKQNLILHPTNAIPKVRKTLCKLRYEIKDEVVVEENGVFNVILFAEYSGKRRYMSAKKAYLGPLMSINKSEETKKYFERSLNSLKTVNAKTNGKKFGKEIK